MNINDYYDIFISFKDSDENGKDTKDKAIAHELYEYLTSKNLKVFFSSETFLEHGTDEWRNELVEAMNISKVFIAVGTNKEYMQSEYLIWERTFFSALRSKDNTRVLYSYIELPLNLKDLPFEMKALTSFTPQTKERLYIYIKNHLNNIKKLKTENKVGTRYERLFDSISIMIIPFIIILSVLFVLSNFIYSRLEFQDTIYSLSIMSIILAKVFLFLKKRKTNK